MVSVSSLQLMELCVHQSYAPEFYPQQWLTTLIIIPLLQQQENPSMALVFPSSSICVISHVGVVVINPHRSSSTRSVVPLPSKYTNVPPAALKSKVFNALSVNGPVALHTLMWKKQKWTSYSG